MPKLHQSVDNHINLPSASLNHMAPSPISEAQKPGHTASGTLADSGGISNLLEEQEQPTTTKFDIIGWCLYSWAAEPFVVSAVSTYVPLLLEQIARDNGVKYSDKISPCEGSRVPIPSPPLVDSDSYNDAMSATVSSMLLRRDDSMTAETDDSSCVLPLFNGSFYIDTSSYALYTFSISVLFQTVLVISMSGAADRGSHRKSLLVIFGVVGALFTIGFWFVHPDSYYTASLLAIFANASYGGASVCGNSFLSLLVNNSQQVKDIQEDETASNEDKVIKTGEVSSRISGFGAACGYVSALIVQILTMLIILKMKHGPTENLITPIKVVVGFVGLWWLIFQIPLQILLKSRSSPELKLDHIRKPIYGDPEYLKKLIKYQVKLLNAYILHGYKTLFHALKQARQLQDICFFLMGWFVISDSLTTINSTAILFAKTNLKMSTLQLSQIGVLTMISAIAGSILIPTLIQPYFKWTIKQTLIFIIIWASVIPTYGILGFFIDSIGLHHWVEMYILAIWYGFSLGGIATLSRSFYSMLIPKGQESVFFALFSITDKGSSVLGPFLVGLVIDYTHEIRKCFWLLLLFLLISIPIFSYVDIQRGIDEANVLEHGGNEIEDD